MTLKDRKILITGGAGFIGSTLAERLIPDNEVVIYDNLSRNSLAAKAVRSHPNLRLIEGDVLDSLRLAEAMEGCSHVVHCAAIAGINTVSSRPVKTMEVNLLGSSNVLAIANAQGGIERVLCLSTSEVFGRQAFRCKETDSCVIGAMGEPRWTYAVAKLAEEHLASAYFLEFGLPIVVLRPFNVYGPGQVGEGAIRNFILGALANEELRIFGDGSQIRSWCFIDDMIEAIYRALVAPAAIGRSFNVGNPVASITIHQLAHMIVDLVGSSSTIRNIDAPQVDVDLRIPDVGLMRDTMGFEARIGLRDGILRTAAYYRAQANASA
ncbi:MAG: NAD-dependent epimerase/dehydratase family protein [Magnetospirillum sp.]|nr:MAG: NAD-dependent epimerase/dehydratase family protein [Magnetospirillum sp.]